jgi:outer membrane protein TolC
MIRSSFTIALMASLLAGCAAVPHDKPAFTPLAAPTMGLEGPSASVASDWWTAMNDPQLDRIMADALAGNPSLDAAIARLRVAMASIDAGRAGLRPQISADVQETRTRLSEKYIIPPPYGGSTQWVGSAQANLSWSLDLAGKQKAIVAQARANADAAGLDVAAARIALSSAVASTYVNLARAEAQAKIADEFVASRQEQLGLAHSRVRNQLASRWRPAVDDPRAGRTRRSGCGLLCDDHAGRAGL